MLTRTTFAALLALSTSVHAEEHIVRMLNAAPNDAQNANVYEPAVLFVEPGDTVTFIPTDNGHNSASKRGMIPEGAEPWNSPLDQEFSITLTVTGVYGFICVPHYEMGMVGMIQVGSAPPNLAAAKKVRQIGQAKKAFRALFEELENK